MAPLQQMDIQWFEQVQHIFVEPYKYLKIPSHILEEEKKSFLDGEIRNPHFEGKYDIPAEELEYKLSQCESLLEEVQNFAPSSQPEEAMQSLYLSFLKGQRFALLMLLNVGKDDNAFVSHARDVYGELDREVCAFSVRNVDLSPIEHYPEVYQRLQDFLRKAQDYLKEEQGSIPFLSEVTETFTESEEEEEVSAPQIKEYFQKYLQQNNLAGWSVKIDASGRHKSLNADQEDKIVWVPQNRVMSHSKMRALAAHEIGVHVRRRENGEAQPIKLLGLGLPGYLKCEEGLTTAWEQKLLGAYPYYRSWPRYVAMAYAQGILTEEPQDFRSTFELLCDLVFLENPALSIEECREKAWKHCWRIFRGTTGQTPGAIFPKDEVYREGNIRVWQAIHEGYIHLENTSLYQAKFDVLNPNQWDSLQMLKQ